MRFARRNSILAAILAACLTLLVGSVIAPALATTAAAGVPVAAQNPGRVHHVVLVWLKEPGNAEARRQMIEGSARLRDIPGVLSVVAGTPLASERPAVDDSFDVGLEITFESADVVDAYLQHPIHLQVVADTLVPLMDHYVVYDILE